MSKYSFQTGVHVFRTTSVFRVGLSSTISWAYMSGLELKRPPAGVNLAPLTKKNGVHLVKNSFNERWIGNIFYYELEFVEKWSIF